MSGVAGGQHAILVRAFMSRLVDGETATASVAQAQFLIWTAALLTFPSLRMSTGAWFMYAEVAARTPEAVDLATYWHKLFFLGFSVFAVGLLTLVIWDGIFPDRRDAFVFGSLPVRARTLVVSRLAALVGVVMLVILACNLPTIVVFSAAAGGHYGTYGFLQHAAAHVITTFAAGLTTFSLIVLAQSLILNVFSSRWATGATVVLQVALVVIVVQSLFTFPGSATSAREAALGSEPAWYSVPLWFLGLYEWIAGSARTEVVVIGWRALASAAGVTVAAMAMYGLTYQRLCTRALESAELAGVRGRTWPLPSTPRFAVASFALLTLLRSRRHRLLFALYLGVGLAIGLPEILRAATGAPGGVPPVRTLAIPLILIFLASAGVRVLFAMPREIDANWVFRMTERPDRQAHAVGASDAALVIGVFPVVLFVTPLIWRGWGGRPALAHAAFSLVMGALLVEALLISFRKIPFACSYLPGGANVRKWWPLYLTAFTTFTFTMARVSQMVMTSAHAAILFYSTALAAWTLLRLLRRRYIARLPGFAFEEEAGDTPVLIELSQPNARRLPFARVRDPT